jgi:phosphatidylglycerol---prolipoprotein diacylglyceryl transferase
VLFRIGDFEITSFGVLVAVGALVGVWLFGKELRRAKLPPTALDAALAGILGGLAGAKVVWSVEHAATAPFTELLFSRGGLSWYGGLAGGLLVGIGMLFRRRLPLVPILAAATPALAVGHAIGRIGCFMVGDDYGRPSDLPWAVAFPNGLPPTDIPVHPTQLYEAAVLVPLAWVLIRWRRRGLPDREVLGRYLVAIGAVRFIIEFVRVHEPIVGPLAVAHIASLLAIGAGLCLLVPLRLPFRNT